MTAPGFPDCTLVLLGHGTTQNPDSAKPVLQHALELRRRRVFAEVREAFWKQDPSICDALVDIKTSRLVIVPFFLTEGYFSDEHIPKQLGFSAPGPDGIRCTSKGAQSWLYTRPIGAHESMADLVLARAEAVLRDYPFPRPPPLSKISLFLAAHGTERNANSRKAVDAEVARISIVNQYHSVHAVFLEDTPGIPQVYSLATTNHIVVVPHFLSSGLHVNEDIPVLLGESPALVQQRLAQGHLPWRNPTEKHGKLLWYARSLGDEPRLTETILALATPAATMHLPPPN